MSWGNRTPGPGAKCSYTGKLCPVHEIEENAAKTISRLLTAIQEARIALCNSNPDAASKLLSECISGPAPIEEYGEENLEPAQ